MEHHQPAETVQCAVARTPADGRGQTCSTRSRRSSPPRFGQQSNIASARKITNCLTPSAAGSYTTSAVEQRETHTNRTMIKDAERCAGRSRTTAARMACSPWPAGQRATFSLAPCSAREQVHEAEASCCDGRAFPTTSMCPRTMVGITLHNHIVGNARRRDGEDASGQPAEASTGGRQIGDELCRAARREARKRLPCSSSASTPSIRNHGRCRQRGEEHRGSVGFNDDVTLVCVAVGTASMIRRAMTTITDGTVVRKPNL